MARGGRSSNRTAGRRDTSVLSLTSRLPAALPPLALSPLSLFEDRRAWDPDPERGALTFGGRYARMVVHTRPVIARANTLWSPSAFPVGIQVPVGVRFESPFKVITCLRRKVRREIMFARNKAGRGVPKRKSRRSWRSNVVC